MNFKYKLYVLLAFSLLAGCGSGGGSADPELLDTDGDSIADAIDADDDNDGVDDIRDAFPLDSLEWADFDGDQIGDNADLDDDNDGKIDLEDAFPHDSDESVDSDDDGIGDNADPDDDNDGVEDVADSFPLNNSESADSDEDGVGDNSDGFPNDAGETTDSDGDGTGDNSDVFPNDVNEWLDTDGDGAGDNADAFPDNPGETTDTDGDGVGDVADMFPNDSSETADTDSDALGDNRESAEGTNPNLADTDGDGLTDGEELLEYLTNPLLDDTDGDGVSDGDEVLAGTDPLVDEGDDIDSPLGFYELPSDWPEVAVEDQACAVSGRPGGENVYTETLSKLFTWLSGTVEEAHYEPIGEVANYFGFAALRNEIRDSGKSDQGYRGAVSREVLELLDYDQRQLMYQLLDEHRDAINGFLADRILLVDELWALKDGQQLDFARVEELMLSVGEYEGEITVITAQNYAEIMETLTEDQMDYLEDMRVLNISVEDMNNTVLTPYGQDANDEFDMLSRDDQDLMAEVTSKIVSWATGSVEDSHFLPEGKIGNFFGFSSYRYIDRANVQRGTVANFMDGLNSGDFEGVLTEDQQKFICGLATNVVDYTNDYVDGRETLITGLDSLKGNPFLSTSGYAIAYANQAGKGEGRRAVVEALTFHLVESMMTTDQIQQIHDYRAGTID